MTRLIICWQKLVDFDRIGMNQLSVIKWTILQLNNKKKALRLVTKQCLSLKLGMLYITHIPILCTCSFSGSQLLRRKLKVKYTYLKYFSVFNIVYKKTIQLWFQYPWKWEFLLIMTIGAVREYSSTHFLTDFPNLSMFFVLTESLQND